MQKGKVLGIDYGSKRIGIASGDLQTKIAFPREIIPNKGIIFVIERLLELIGELSVKKIVVGLPLNIKQEHEENKIMKEMKDFALHLKENLESKKMEVDVDFFDERLSSFEADQILDQLNVPNHERRKFRDEFSAQIILQRYFDRI